MYMKAAFGGRVEELSLVDDMAIVENTPKPDRTHFSCKVSEDDKKDFDPL
jgi:hypothetical protein